MTYTHAAVKADSEVFRLRSAVGDPKQGLFPDAVNLIDSHPLETSRLRFFWFLSQ